MDRVRPLEDRSEDIVSVPRAGAREPRRRRLLPAALAIVAAAVFGPAIGMRPTAPPDVPPPDSVSSTVPPLFEDRPPAHNPDPAVIGPGGAGPSAAGPEIRITTVTRAGLVRFTPSAKLVEHEDRALEKLPVLDALGSHAAWIADSGTFRSVLHVERLDDPAPTIVYAGSSPVWDAVWHDSRPGRIAAVGLDRTGSPTLTVASVVLDGFPKQKVVDLGALSGEGGWWTIEAWGDWGFLLHHVQPPGDHSGELIALDASGEFVARLFGAEVIGVLEQGAVAVETLSGSGTPVFLDAELSHYGPGGLPSVAVKTGFAQMAVLPNGRGVIVDYGDEIVVHPSAGTPVVLDRWPIGWSSDGSLIATAARLDSGRWRLAARSVAGEVVAELDLAEEPVAARIRPLTTSAVTP